MHNQVCPESIEAIAGSIAAVCEAVDITFDTSTTVSGTTANLTPCGASEQDLINLAPSPATKQEGIDAIKPPERFDPLTHSKRIQAFKANGRK